MQGSQGTPRLPRGAVPRSRVAGRLDGVLDVPLTVVSAPAGFGKSTAVVQWLQLRDPGHAWVALEARDAGWARFVQRLAAACSGGTADPVAAPPGEALGDPSQVADELAIMLAERPAPWVLVLDDLHTVPGAGVGALLEHLVAVLPGHVHLVLVTREDPPLRLSRLRLRGAVLELRADDLRFTADEAADVLAARFGLRLPADGLARLVSRTEGWPAVVQLAGLWLAGGADPGERLERFAADHRLVLDYVAEEVLDGLDEETTDFLLTTCVADRLTGDLCNRLTGRDDGVAVLERLERANLLLVPLDDGRTWYRYHRLFLDLLRLRARSLPPERLVETNLRAAQWHRERGDHRRTLEHAVAAGDLGRAWGLVWASSGALLHAGDLAAVRQLLDGVPPGIARSSLLVASMQAWALALGGDGPAAERWLDHAEHAMTRLLPGEEALAQPFPGVAAMIRSVVARLDGRAEDAVRLARLSLSLEPQLPPGVSALYRGDGLTVLGHAQLAAGDDDGATATYREAVPLARRAGNLLAAAEMVRNLARVQARRGNPEDGLATCEDALRTTGGEEPSDALVLLTRAELLAGLGRADSAGAAARAHDLAVRSGDLGTAREARLLATSAPPAPPAARETSRPGLPEGRSLTARELDVLRLAAAGRSNRQIAEELYLTVGTVKSYLHSVSTKLDVANRVQATVRARELGLLP